MRTFFGNEKFVRTVRTNTIANLASVKAVARRDGTDDDDYIQQVIPQAKSLIEKQIGRSLDNNEYLVSFKLYAPEKGDRLWIPVAPVDTVTLSGVAVTTATRNGFDFWIEYETDWDSELEFTVNTSWSTDIIGKTVKMPFYEICNAYITTRELSLAKPSAVISKIEEPLAPYVREV